MKVSDIFNADGNFRKPFDPYRTDHNDNYYQSLFDEDGYTIQYHKETIYKLDNKEQDVEG